MLDWLTAMLNYEFVQRALIATTVLSVSVAPIGAFMVLRRLSLAGEALAHGIIPGIAIAFLLSGGLSVWAMLVGGTLAGLAVALSATILARWSVIREDAGLASLYLIALAVGVFILSLGGSGVPLRSFLFGSILGLSDGTLILIAAVNMLTLVSLALIIRPLMISTLDPVFFESQSNKAWLLQVWFMLLVVLNLIASFRALGTLMAVGLMILPATAARYWVTSMTSYSLLSIGFAVLSCWIGIAVSLALPDIPTGPSIILIAGGFFTLSLVLGRNGLRQARANP